MAWLQPLVAVLAVVALLVSGYFAINQSASADTYLIPALVFFCWCLLIITLIGMFQAPPPQGKQGLGFYGRLLLWFHRKLRSLITLAFLALTVSLIILSYKLLTTGIG